eukprot:gene15353-biopygen6673
MPTSTRWGTPTFSSSRLVADCGLWASTTKRRRGQRCVDTRQRVPAESAGTATEQCKVSARQPDGIPKRMRKPDAEKPEAVPAKRALTHCGVMEHRGGRLLLDGRETVGRREGDGRETGGRREGDGRETAGRRQGDGRETAGDSHVGHHTFVWLEEDSSPEGEPLLKICAYTAGVFFTETTAAKQNLACLNSTMERLSRISSILRAANQLGQ